MNQLMSKWLPIVSRRFTVFRMWITALGSRDEVRRYLGVGCDYLVVVKNELGQVYLLKEDTKIK